MSLIDSKTLQRSLDQLLTVHDLCVMFNVSSMTIHTWRKDRDLPTIVVKGGPRENVRNAVRFHPEDVTRWAKCQGLSPRPLPARQRIRIAA